MQITLGRMIHHPIVIRVTGIQINTIKQDKGVWSETSGIINGKGGVLSIDIRYKNLNMFEDTFNFNPPTVTLPAIDSLFLRYEINLFFDYTSQFPFSPDGSMIAKGLHKILTDHLSYDPLPPGWGIPGITDQKIEYMRDKKINISNLLHLNTSINHSLGSEPYPTVDDDYLAAYNNAIWGNGGESVLTIRFYYTLCLEPFYKYCITLG